MQSSLQGTELASEYFAECIWGVIDLWEVCTNGALGFAPCFKMGFNRDDCLTMGDSDK